MALDRARLGPITFTPEEAHDMELGIFFLQRAANSISINLIVFRGPDITVWLDSCPSSMGGCTSLGRPLGQALQQRP